MQTFLSEPTFQASVVALDTKRLNKQLLEGVQILTAISLTLDGPGTRINGKIPFASNHPVTNQWRGYEYALEGYLWLAKYELKRRGVKTEKSSDNLRQVREKIPTRYGLPPWLKDSWLKERLMLTHRANLYRKDPEHYAQYAVDSLVLSKYNDVMVCCTTHAPYFYPAHLDTSSGV